VRLYMSDTYEYIRPTARYVDVLIPKSFPIPHP
jgi:hypothetical protein